MINSFEHGHDERTLHKPERPQVQPLQPPVPAGEGRPEQMPTSHSQPTQPQRPVAPLAPVTVGAEIEQVLPRTGGIIFDRSRSQLRIPRVLVNECLQFTQALALSLSVGESRSAGAEKVRADNSELVNRLRAARVIVNDRLDPMAEEMLTVCSQASLNIKVNLSYAAESSTSTVWATPRRAVVSDSLDPHFAEFRPVDVARLPVVLAELMVLRRPSFVGGSPVSVGTRAVAAAETQLADPARATTTLVGAGLSAEQAALIINFQGSNVRRWRVSSSWSVADGTETSELRGLDAGPSGQWLVAMTGCRDEPGQMTFTPQGSGDVVRALRSILPRSWVGTPLKRQIAD